MYLRSLVIRTCYQIGQGLCSHFSCCCHKTPDKRKLKKEELILVQLHHGTEGRWQEWGVGNRLLTLCTQSGGREEVGSGVGQ